MATGTERALQNALKFGTTREVDSNEGGTHGEGLLFASPNCSEVEAPQEELDGAVEEAPIPYPRLQCQRTKLIFDVRIDDPFLD